MRPGSFAFNRPFAVSGPENDPSVTAVFRRERLARFGVGLKPASGSVGQPAVHLRLEAVPGLKPQGYRLEVKPRETIITGRDAGGLFYGIQTLFSLAEAAGGARIPCVDILDWPDLPIRGVHITLKKHLYRFPLLLDFVRELGRHKVNMLVLEYEYRFPYRRHPVLAGPGALTAEQVTELISLAREYHIQVVPLVDSLGHAEWYLCHPEFEHLKELPGQIQDMCPLHPGTLRAVQDVCRDMFSFHPSPYFHIGGDETFLLGSCPRCRKFAQEHGHSALFVHYYGPLCRWLIEHGKTPILWPDMFLKYPEALDDMPKETIMMEWDYAGIDTETAPSVHGLNRNTLDTYFSANARRIFTPYLKNPHFPERFVSYPYVRFFHARGFPVIGATAFSSGTLVPDFTGRCRNNRGFARRLTAEKALGLVNTFWPSFLSVEAAWYGLLAGAEYSWCSTAGSCDRYRGKFVRDFLGIAEDADGIGRALMLMEQSQSAARHDGLITREKTRRRAKNAATARSVFHPRRGVRHQRHYNYLAHAARIQDYLARLDLMLFDIEDSFLGAGRRVTYAPVSLSAFCNNGFVSTRGKNGWVDDMSGMRCFPSGRLRFRSIPFEVIDQRENRGMACVFLKGPARHGDSYPAVVSGIPVGRRVEALHFLQAGGYVNAARAGEEIGEYRLHYSDGTSAVKKLINNVNMTDWLGRGPRLADAVLAWKGDVVPGNSPRAACVYITSWINPHPEKEVVSLDLASTGVSIPILLGVTGRIPTGAGRRTLARARAAQLRGIRSYRRELRSLQAATDKLFRTLFVPEDVQHAVDTGLPAGRIGEVLDTYESALKKRSCV